MVVRSTSTIRRAFSYIRFSTPEQLKGDSLRRQTSLTAEYCERNGLLLDDSLNLRDLGVSAFRGGNAETGALACFLDAVKSGRVPAGAILIVENLDRLTRDEIGEALALFISILKSGVQIVTLRPEVEYTRKSINEIGVILQAVLQLFLGHEESAKKSGRLSEAWDAKRARIAVRKLTGKCPFWLRLAEDGRRFVLRPEGVALVNRLFRLARSEGSKAIARTLNAEGILSPYGRPWNNVSVLSILRSRAVFGEFTPHRGHSQSRRAAGSPIPDYYPSILSEAEFYAVQAAIIARKCQRGPRGKSIRNLFTGLLHDARDGTPFHVSEKRKGDCRLVPSGAIRGAAGSKYVSFPLAPFERAVVSLLDEVDPRDVFGGEDDDPAEAEALKGELNAVRAKKAEVEAELLNGDLAELAKALRQLTTRERELDDRLAQAQRAAATPAGESLKEAKSLLAALGDPEKRLRLRSVLPRFIDEMRLLVVPRGDDRLAALQIRFAGGEYHRDYLIYYRVLGGGKGAGRGRRKGEWSVASLSEATSVDDLDLRDPRKALRLEQILLAADIVPQSGQESAPQPSVKKRRKRRGG